MRPATWKTLLGGLVATTALTVLMKKGPPLLGARAIDPGATLGRYFGGNRAAGIAAHFFTGAALFPMMYANLAFDFLPGKPQTRGMIWGAGLWLFSQTVAGPAMGHGAFSARRGGPKASAGSLAGHLAYGAVLGTIASYGDEQRLSAVRQRWLGRAA